VEVREQYQIKISNRFEALQNLIDSKDINRPWKKIRISISEPNERLCLYQWKQHTPCFDDERSQISDQRKQAKMQWL
jgi:hypothetical protein